ncbi:hypothetical protein [Polaromonas sp.]|uniref:hypothetical protein n=1 Tax=Polaromonas sp. TaxID=1869339 RepID=UPI0027376BC2|nr:hypothetical protein [Polaromonas sp.]MDP2448719.1 hypothetical protein [Polaromonas sp.]
MTELLPRMTELLPGMTELLPGMTELLTGMTAHGKARGDGVAGLQPGGRLADCKPNWPQAQ